MTDPTPAAAALAVRLLDSSPDGLVLVDADGVIGHANRTAAAMFGYTDADFVGMSVDELVPADLRDRHVDHRRSYARKPERRPIGTGLELLARHRNGGTFPVEISLSPITVDDRVQTVATIRDVTERQEVAARLALHRERERIARDLYDLVIQRLFAAGMSLQSVTNLIESAVARDRVVAVTEELDETVTAVRSAIFGLGQDERFQSLTSEVNACVHERTARLGFKPDLSITGEIDDLSDLVGDQLLAALTEALVNVARHANANTATIEIIRSDRSVELRVRDNGGGISTNPKPKGGLTNVMWRAVELGGSCSVGPVEPNGTELTWNVPT